MIDVTVGGGGTLYIFTAHTERATEWINENVSPDGFQPGFPSQLIVEHRYARELAAGMIADGLKVE